MAYEALLICKQIDSRCLWRTAYGVVGVAGTQGLASVCSRELRCGKNRQTFLR